MFLEMYVSFLFFINKLLGICFKIHTGLLINQQITLLYEAILIQNPKLDSVVSDPHEYYCNYC